MALKSEMDLKSMSRYELLEALFNGETDEKIIRRQAAYELSRRNDMKTFILQITFVALSAIAATASAIAAIISVNNV